MSNKDYLIQFTQKAVDDLNEVFVYISAVLNAQESARNLMDKFEKGIKQLKHFPYSRNFVLDETLKNKGYRKLVVDNYIVFYLVDEEEKRVMIMRILYGAQQYEDKL